MGKHRAYPLLILSVVLSITFTACTGVHPNKGSTTSNPSSPPPRISDGGSSLAPELSESMADVVERVKPAVILISAVVQTKSFFGQLLTSTKSGSGVIIDPTGYAITNSHVVENAYKIEVTLPGSQESVEAGLVGRDPLTDLAVIKIRGNSFPYVSFSAALQPRPGELVIAIGHPLALEGGSTITLGVVSNTQRSFRIGKSMFYDIIQTDAAINPGNSGGPLVNVKGEIIGINTFIAAEAQNMGFAVSANTAQSVYEELIRPPHRMIRPWLGVSLRGITPEVAQEEGLFKKKGILIAYVKQGSPADEAGLKERDVITEFEGQGITDVTQFLKLLWEKHEPGEEATLIFWRDEDQHTATVKLGERPG